MTHHSVSEFLQLLRSGATPVVTFAKGIEECEGFPVQGMRAKVLRGEVGPDNVLKLVFEYSEFESFNSPLEVHSYYDRDGNPTLSAREAGQYSPIETLCLMANEPITDAFHLAEDASTALFRRYTAEQNTGKSYVQWLEAKVARLEVSVAAADMFLHD